MSFQALEVSLALIRSLRAPLARLVTHDSDLADQLRRAASGAALNLGEGRRRTGKDRAFHFRVGVP